MGQSGPLPRRWLRWSENSVPVARHNVLAILVGFCAVYAIAGVITSLRSGSAG